MSSPLPYVAFSKLWEHFPDDKPCVDKNGNPPPGWSNQCAVRVSAALAASGVSLASFNGARCPTVSRDTVLAASAQALANWLRQKQRFGNIRPLEHVPPKTWEKSLTGRTGIVFFKDYWRRTGETHGPGSGDHIDLWNRDTLTGGFVSFLRFRVGITSIPNLFAEGNYYSDLSQSAEIWFWAVV